MVRVNFKASFDVATIQGRLYTDGHVHMEAQLHSFDNLCACALIPDDPLPCGKISRVTFVTNIQ